MAKYQCSRCSGWVEDKDGDVFHFKSVHKPHTLLSIYMCLTCRDDVFAYIRKDAAQQAAEPESKKRLCVCNGWPLESDYCRYCGGYIITQPQPKKDR